MLTDAGSTQKSSSKSFVLHMQTVSNVDDNRLAARQAIAPW